MGSVPLKEAEVVMMQNVLIVIDRLPPNFTGAGLRAIRLSERISKKYNTCFKALCKGKNDAWETVNNLEIRRIKTVDEQGLSFPLYLIQTFLKTNLYLMRNRKRIDIIHFFSFSWMNRMIMLSNILLYKKKTLLEVTLNGSDDPISLLTNGKRNRLFSGLTKFLLKKIDTFIVGSEYGLKSCMTIGVDQRKVIVLPHPCDKKDFGSISFNKKYKLRKKLRLPANKFVLLNVGAIYPRKNQFFITKCVKALNNKNIVLVLIGPPGLKDQQYLLKIKRYIKKHKLEQQILIMGEQKNVNEYMMAADTFVFASKREGFPNAIAESIMSGLPVITTRLDGISGFINAITGFMIAHDDDFGNKTKKAFVKAINLIYYKKKKFNHKLIRGFGINNLSTEKIDRRYNLLYKELLRGNRPNKRQQND